MDIYLVEQITEPDFGCEESVRKEPMALLRLSKLASNSEDKRYIEVSENKLSDEGISEGKKVCFTENGDLKKYVSVVAAIITKNVDGLEKIFATQRGYGDYKDGNYHFLIAEYEISHEDGERMFDVAYAPLKNRN